MKTFLLDILNRVRRFDESLDIKAVLCNKPWVAFDEDGSKQCYIFKEDGGLVIASQGKGKETSWEYLPANKTVKFKDAYDSIELYHPTLFDGDLLVLNLDSTNEYALLLNENAAFKPKGLDEIILHINSIDKQGDAQDKLPSIASRNFHTSKPKERISNRETLRFAEETFTPAERDGEHFYVNHENRYAFSSIEHVFDKADQSFIAKDRDGNFLFYYNGSLNCVHSFSSSKPDWIEYWDGLVLDAILVGNSFVFNNGKWHHYQLYCNEYYRIDKGDGVNEYFCIKDNRFMVVPEEEALKALKDVEQGYKTIAVCLLIMGIVFILVIVAHCFS